MCMSGVLIGMRKTITPQRRTGILEGLKMDCAAFRAAVLGVIRSKPLAQLTEAACRRITRIRTMDFDCASVAEANRPGVQYNLDALEQYRQSGCAPVGSDSGRHRDSRDRIRVCIECAVHRRR